MLALNQKMLAQNQKMLELNQKMLELRIRNIVLSFNRRNSRRYVFQHSELRFITLRVPSALAQPYFLSHQSNFLPSARAVLRPRQKKIPT